MWMSPERPEPVRRRRWHSARPPTPPASPLPHEPGSQTTLGRTEDGRAASLSQLGASPGRTAAF